MQVSHRWKAVPFAALLASTSFVSARADEKPRTLQDFLGQEHAALSQAHSLASSPPLPPGSSAADRFRFWNRIAVDASGRDHTPVGPGETRVYGEQLGPGRSSRAMAIVHIAIYDAVNSILGGYPQFLSFATEVKLSRERIAKKEHVVLSAGEVQQMFLVCQPDGGGGAFRMLPGRAFRDRNPILQTVDVQGFNARCSPMQLNRGGMKLPQHGTEAIIRGVISTIGECFQ
jgi:hypothetical protein